MRRALGTRLSSSIYVHIVSARPRPVLYRNIPLLHIIGAEDNIGPIINIIPATWLLDISSEDVIFKSITRIGLSLPLHLLLIK